MNESETLLINVLGIEGVLDGLRRDIGIAWGLVCGIFAFMVLAGDIFIKAGSAAQANVISCLCQNLAIIAITGTTFFLFGYSFAFGDGHYIIALSTDELGLTSEKRNTHFFKTCVFLFISLSVYAKGVAGVMRLGPFCVVIGVLSAVVYPPIMFWIWGEEGWLSIENNARVGVVLDSAGCTLLFLVGSTALLASAPYMKSGETPCNALGDNAARSSHDKFLVGAGVFLTAFGWCGLLGLENGVGLATSSHALCFFIVSTSFGVLTALFLSVELLGYPDLEQTVPGTFAGIVASTAAAHHVALPYAPIIGAVSTALYFASAVILHRVGISDRNDVVAAHFFPSIWGLLSTAVLYSEPLLSMELGDEAAAIDRGQVVGYTVLGILAAVLWTYGVTAATMRGVNRILGVACHNGIDIMDHNGVYRELVMPVSREPSVLLTYDQTEAGGGVLLCEANGGPGVLLENPAAAWTNTNFAQSIGYTEPRSELLSEEAPKVTLNAPTDEAPGSPKLDLSPKGLWVSRSKEYTVSVSGSPRGGKTEITLDNCSSNYEGEKGSVHWRGVLRAALYVCLVTGCTAVSNVPSLSDNEDGNAAEGIAEMNETLLAAKVSLLEALLTASMKDLDTIWALTCGIMVFLMQLGFCFLESGSVRSGSVINIIFKNLTDCSIGAVAWWLTGYSIAFGSGNAFMGYDANLFAFSPAPGDVFHGNLAHFFLSFTYMTTAATILSGALAERVSLQAYFIFVLVIACFAYPVVAHWVHGDGWLSPFSDRRIAGNGVLDFSGSLTIHMFGGAMSLCLAWLVGPRMLPDNIDVFSEKGQATVAPHNKFQIATGTLILWFSWFAFNAGSVMTMSNGGAQVAATAIITTLIASSSATLTGFVYMRITLGYFDICHACNTALAGLVAITAGCAYVSSGYAAIIGALSIFPYFLVASLRMRFRIDDVLDAGAVHLGGGIWGTIATGLFCDAKRIEIATGLVDVTEYGLFLGGGGVQLGMQMLGMVAVLSWCCFISVIVYYIAVFTVGVRIPVASELRGIDIMEHRAHTYDYIARLEKQKAIEIARNVARSLVRFDLEEAKAYLEEEDEEKPSEHLIDLRAEMLRLMDNLARYRPFLPDSLFHDDDTTETSETALPPGLEGEGEAAICFTDIQGSTAVWEAFPNEMKEALKIHNKIIRQCICTHGGYEVKTIGDSFMVAFAEVETALGFALDVQEGLYRVGKEWPLELSQIPQCAVSPGWHGLRVRIGVNYGSVIPEVNPITARHDYSGPTVNKAARLEAASVGGAVCISQGAYLELSSNFAAKHPLTVVLREQVVLKGVPGKHAVVLIVPQTLSQRKPILEGGAPTAASPKRSSKSSSFVPPAGSIQGAGPPVALVKSRSRPDLCKDNLKRAPATVGAVRLTWGKKVDTAQVVNMVMSTVIVSLDRCEGAMLSVCGHTVCASWNTAKKCQLHYQNAVRFAGMLHTVSNTPELTLRVALVTGSTLHGKVGTPTQKFVNIFSRVVDLAQLLCYGADELNTFALTCTLAPSSVLSADPMLQGSIRPVDTWELTEGDNTAPVIIYELRGQKLKDCEKLVTNDDFGEGSDVAEDPCWGQAYHTAYGERDAEALEGLGLHDDTHVVTKIAALVRTKTHCKIEAIASAMPYTCSLQTSVGSRNPSTATHFPHVITPSTSDDFQMPGVL